VSQRTGGSRVGDTVVKRRNTGLKGTRRNKKVFLAKGRKQELAGKVGGDLKVIAGRGEYKSHGKEPPTKGCTRLKGEGAYDDNPRMMERNLSRPEAASKGAKKWWRRSGAGRARAAVAGEPGGDTRQRVTS